MVKIKNEKCNIKNIIGTSFDYTIEEPIVKSDEVTTKIKYTTKDFNNIRNQLFEYPSKCYYDKNYLNLTISQGYLLSVIDTLVSSKQVLLDDPIKIKMILEEDYDIIWDPSENINDYIEIIKNKNDELDYNLQYDAYNYYDY